MRIGDDVRVPLGLMAACAALIWFGTPPDDTVMDRVTHRPAPPAPAPAAAAPATPPAVIPDPDPVLVSRAQAGDARAAFYMYEHARRCETAAALFDRMGTPPPDDCVGYRAERTAAEWHAIAVRGGDRLARLTDAVLGYLTGAHPDRAALDGALADAAASGDPDVQVALGFALLNPDIHPDPVDGLAWLLAACGDCTTDDPRIGLGCAAVGACAYGGTLNDYLRDTFPEHYPEAALRAAALRVL